MRQFNSAEIARLEKMISDTGIKAKPVEATEEQATEEQ